MHLNACPFNRVSLNFAMVNSMKLIWFNGFMENAIEPNNITEAAFWISMKSPYRSITFEIDRSKSIFPFILSHFLTDLKGKNEQTTTAHQRWAVQKLNKWSNDRLNFHLKSIMSRKFVEKTSIRNENNQKGS